MTIEKLQEFAKNGEKHTRGLDVDLGFPKAEKPERQWFNELFNQVTKGFNQVADSVNQSLLDLTDAKARLEEVKKDTGITVTPKFDGAAERTQAEKNSDSISLSEFIPPDDLIDIKAGASDYDVSDALAAALKTGKRVNITDAGTYKFKAGYNGTTDFDVKATTEGVVFDFNESDADYPIKNSGSVTLLSNQFTAPDAKDISVDFTSVNGLEVGDWLCFYCPTDYSYSKWRPYYRAGEWVKIKAIVDNKVIFERPFTDSLQGLTLELYKLNSVVCRLQNVKLVRNDEKKKAGIVRFSLSSNASDTNVEVDAIVNAPIIYDRCTKPVSRYAKGKNIGRGTDDYLLLVANCQSARVYNADAYARRHAVALGGGVDVCGVPVTDFRCYDSVLNADPEALAGGADMHGNVRDSSYERCTVYAGSNIGGGDNNWFIDCDIYADSIGRVGFCREMIGGASGWIRPKIHLNGSPRAANRGIFDIGGNSAAIDERTIKDTYIEVKDVKIMSAKGLDDNIGESLVRAKATGYQHHLSMDIDGASAVCDMPSLYTALYLYSEDGDSPAQVKSKGIVVDNFKNISVSLFVRADGTTAQKYTDAHIPMRMMSQSGICEGVVNIDDSEVLPANTSYKIAYPREPKLQGHLYAVGANAPYNSIGGRQDFKLFPIIQKNQIRAKITLPAGAKFTEADTYTLNWTVGINEV